MKDQHNMIPALEEFTALWNKVGEPYKKRKRATIFKQITLAGTVPAACYCCCCCCSVTSVVSDSVQPHRWQPTRLPRPWDSLGKNTGVGCHFLLQCMKVRSEREVAQSCPTLRDPMDCSLPGSSVHGIFQARVLEWGAIAFSDLLLRFILLFGV